MTERVVCFDGEGVIWHRGYAVEGANEIIDKIRQLGYRSICITNNGSKSVKEYLERFQASGYTNFKEEDVITAARSVEAYLKSKGFDKPGRKIFVIGTAGFVSQLKLSNLSIVTTSDYDNQDIHTMELDPRVCVVVVGSSEQFSYRHLTIATRYVIENDAILISANPDDNYPYSKEVLVPGAHALCECIAAASNRQTIALGKPQKSMFEAIPGYQNIDRKNSWMIGDRIITDIRFAKAAGLRSILVLTGVTTREDCKNIKEEDKPDFICNDLQDCYELIKRETEKLN